MRYIHVVFIMLLYIQLNNFIRQILLQNKARINFTDPPDSNRFFILAEKSPWSERCRLILVQNLNSEKSRSLCERASSIFKREAFGTDSLFLYTFHLL